MIETLNTYKPQLISRFKRNVENTLNNLVDIFGPDLKGIYNTTSARVFNNVLKPVLNLADKTINEDKLNAAGGGAGEGGAGAPASGEQQVNMTVEVSGMLLDN